MESPLKTCTGLPPVSYALEGAVGGLTFGDAPIICGGYNRGNADRVFSDCFTFQSGAWNHTPMLKNLRGFASSIVSPDPSQKLFIIGGMNIFPGTYLNTIEVLTSSGWSLSSIVTPVSLGYHCSVMINPDKFMVIGGKLSQSLTYLFSFKTQTWVQGPSLTIGWSI